MAQELLPTGLQVVDLYIIDREEPWDYLPVAELSMQLYGIHGDRHSGLMRTVKAYESRELAGRSIANDRQVSLVEAADIEAIAHGLELPIETIEERADTSIDKFMAGQLAANILLRSTTDSSLNEILVPGLLLAFGTDKQSALLRTTGYNEPCSRPAKKLIKTLEALDLKSPLPLSVLGARFKEVAKDKRGWHASVHSVGTVSIGQEVSAYAPVLPTQPNLSDLA